ncbi:MAG: zf-HC2 domain-containing protein [Gemmatimonadota bacterium]|jgi:predicted anti-sigma-YlaC factor YlaD
MTTDGRSNGAHLTDEQLVAYLGQELRGEDLKRVEGHLADCVTCRWEVVDANQILEAPRVRRLRVLVPVAAAAAVVLLFLSGGPEDAPTGRDRIHRETAVELSEAPSPLSPVGPVTAVDGFAWTAAAGADRYRVTLFDAEGTVLWSTATADSVARLPESLTLEAGQPYLWRVEGRIGWDVWESSEFVEFRVEGRQD